MTETTFVVMAANCGGALQKMELMSRADISEGIAALSVSIDGLDKLLDDPGLLQEGVEEWLAWAKGQPTKVRVVEGVVPPRILPQGIVGKLLDVKVGGKFGPDDAMYNSSAELRDRIARGNTVLQLEDTRTGKVSKDMVTFALKKFTGGMGDEDEDQPENEQVWQRYFLSPMEEVEKVVCVIKENGEAAHLSVRMIQGSFYYFCGSKNVHLMFRTKEELEKYTEQRYMVAKTVAQAWLNQASDMEPKKLRLFCSFLHTTKMTAVFEVLCPDYQHVVSLSHLSTPELRFLTFTLQYGAASLTGLPPHTSLILAARLGLATATHHEITASKAEARMEEVRAGYGYEGEVLYFLDKEDRTVGLVKKKTAWYVLCRAIREKVNTAKTQYRKEGSMSKQKENLQIEKLERRVNEIQTWLDLDDAMTKHWRLLGKNFFKWMLNQLMQNPDKLEELCARGCFPQQWQAFLIETGISDRSPGSRKEETEKDKSENTPSSKLTNPLEGSPTVTVVVQEEELSRVKPHLATCVVRGVDLLGKNMKKMQNAVQKSRQRGAKNPALPFIGVHDLRRVERDVTFTQGNPAIVPHGGKERLSVSELRSRGLLGQNMSTDDTHPFLRQGNSVISIHPLLTSEETKLTEDTEDIFLEVSSTTSQRAAEEALEGFLKHIYHMGISLEGRDKFIHVERGVIILPAGTKISCPANFDPNV